MEQPTTLTALLAARCGLETPCLVDRDTPVSYRTLDAQSRRVAAALRARGVAAGDRVAVWLPNGVPWLAAFFACARLGAIAVAVNTRFRSSELADIVGRSGACVLFVRPGFDKADFAGVLADCPTEALAGLHTIVRCDEPGDREPASLAGTAARVGATLLSYDTLLDSGPLDDDAAAPDAGVAIFTTSGTTRAPKFVLHDQRTLLAHAFDVVRGFAIGPDATMMLAPPLCGVFGACCVLAMLTAGRPFTLLPAWDVAAAAAQIDRWQATHLNATDDAVAQLLAHVERTPAFPSLRFVGYAAFNPAHADIVARADARGLTMVGLYGISEIQALFARQDETAPAAERMLAGGRPVSPLARVRARDPESGRVLPHGEAGELEFLAPSSRMVGYFANPEATAQATTDDGWYRSGDLGYSCADGRFVYLTRIGDTLRLGGFLVSPAEIEACVQQVAGIDGCQVVGATTGGALRPVAFVTLRPGATLDEAATIAHVAARLARYKVPVRVLPIDAFPVTEGTNANKIQKHRLRDLAQSTLDRG